MNLKLFCRSCALLSFVGLSWLSRGEPAKDSCPAGSMRGDAACSAGDKGTAAAKFWADMRRQGFELRLAEAGPDADSKQLAKRIVLSQDVFYSRPTLRVPLAALIDSTTITDVATRDALAKCLVEPSLKRETTEVQRLLDLALAVLVEKRSPSSVFHAWLDALEDDKHVAPVLMLTERQRHVLIGTTATTFCTEAPRLRNLLTDITSMCQGAFGGWVASEEEAGWALGVVLRHGHMVRQGHTAGSHAGGLSILPLRELLAAPRHPDPSVATVLHTEKQLAQGGSEAFVSQRAQRDMLKGEEVWLWAGRMSNSEAALRFGLDFTKNPVGIGGKVARPPNWSGNLKAPNMQEFAKFNCSSLDVFEMRFSPKGWPMRIFVRCWRLAWHMERGWYSASYLDRIDDLDKWPPPPKYSHQDWLYWTQADREVNRVILEYCQAMKRQLKETVTAATATEFRAASDPMDQLVWNIRSEESKAFQKCVELAKQFSMGVSAAS